MSSPSRPPEDISLRDVLAKLQRVRPVTLEEMFTSPDMFNVPASPLQRAICRAVDGRPLGDLATPEILAAFGGVPPKTRPLEVDILSGIRGGKSLFAAANGVHQSQICDLSRLRPGDIARVSIVSLTKRNSAAVYSHLLHSVRASERLSAMLDGEPSADTLYLKHPSGRRVEISVMAGDRAGGSLVSTWSAGVIFDEYTRMVGEEEGVINYDEMYSAVIGRLLPGAQVLSIGSPYGSTGPAYRRFNEHFGKVGRVLVIKAPGWEMNPTFWTKEKVEEFKASNPDQYRTDCAAEFSSVEDSMFPLADVNACTRQTPQELDWEEGCEYVAAMDPGTRGNAWTMVVVTRRGPKKRVALARQWIGTHDDPLDPDIVMSEVSDICRRYKVRTIWSDQVMFDALRSIASNYRLSMVQKKWTSSQRIAAFTNLKLQLASREVELPPNQYVREDLLRVRKRVTASGPTVHIPETGDGRHCDYAPVLAMAMTRWMHDKAEPKRASNMSQDEKRAWDEVARKLANR